MFSKPHAGWTNIDIGGYKGHGSYLTDIPLDFLSAALYALRNNAPFALYIDEEGVTTYITSYHDETFVNRTTDNIETYYSQTGFKDLIADGVTDIEQNVNEWARFDTDADEDEVKTRTFMIMMKIGDLKILLNRYC